jgi:hypothetical protein
MVNECLIGEGRLDGLPRNEVIMANAANGSEEMEIGSQMSVFIDFLHHL